MSVAETLSVAGSVVSIILAGFAIWLAIVFNKLSDQNLRDIRAEAIKIAHAVSGVEQIFDKLNNNTHSLLRETVLDISKHAWAGNTVAAESEARAQARLEELQQRVQAEVTRLVSTQHSTNARLSQVSVSVERLLQSAAVESRKIQAEAREETIRDHIIGVLRTMKRAGIDLTFGGALERLRSSLSEKDVIEEVRRMREDGTLSWSGPSEKLRWSDKLELLA